MELDLVAEDRERALDETDHAVRMAAGSAAANLLQPAQRICAAVASACRKRLEGAGESREAVDAGSTLAGALVGEVAGDAGGLVESAGNLGQDDDRAGAERGTGPRQRCVVEGEPLRLEGVDPTPEVAADEEGASFWYAGEGTRILTPPAGTPDFKSRLRLRQGELRRAFYLLLPPICQRSIGSSLGSSRRLSLSLR
jgi:hypothetical protein